MLFSTVLGLFSVIAPALASEVGIEVTHKVENCKHRAQNGQDVSVHYTGKLENGEVFDTSSSRDPISFKLGAGRVIKGWEQGILDMCVGEKRTLNIPSELGYGERGIGPIPPNANLVFDVELVSIGGVDKDEL